VLDCEIMYILLIIEHNGAVSHDKLQNFVSSGDSNPLNSIEGFWLRPLVLQIEVS